MGKFGAGVVFAAVVVLSIVSVDLIFFRHHFAERLFANIGIVLIVGAFFFRFYKYK